MKILLSSLFLFSFSFSLLAQDCEVYGISDSPQKLNCSMGSEEVKLTCDSTNGSYFINGAPVEVAYHEEVEDGPTPLIFKAGETSLRIMIYSSDSISGEFVENSKSISGRCKPQ